MCDNCYKYQLGFNNVYTCGSQHHNGQNTESQRKARVSAKTMYVVSQLGHQKRRDQRSSVYGQREHGGKVLYLFFLLRQLKLISTKRENTRFYTSRTNEYEK